MNIQTLPRRDKIVKRAFVPKLDYFLFADYDQVEMRVLAYYMAMLGDESMARVLQEGGDLHAESAAGALNIEAEALTDEERQIGKTLNFSLVYGGGRPTIVRQLGVTFPEATRLLRNFHRRWPGIGRVMDSLHTTYTHRGYLRTIAGARLHPDSQHKELNAVVQSSAAEIMRKGLRVSHRELAGMDSHLVCVVHDEFVFDVSADEINVLAESAPIWMDSFPNISEIVPITVSLEWSQTNWADKERY